MIETVLIVVGATVTSVTCASLWLVNALDKRLREDEEENDSSLDDPVTLLPYVQITIDTRCTFCGEGGDQKRGPKVPIKCKWGADCEAHDLGPHLHVTCQSCKARSAMATATTADLITDETVLPFQAIVVGTRCQKCGEPAKNDDSNTTALRGPVVPKACAKTKSCIAKGPHLHMECLTCKAKWFMATADTVKKNGKKKSEAA